MDPLPPRCAGRDVHQDTVVACVRWLDSRQRPQREVKTFGTPPPDLLALLDGWLQPPIPVVAMASTGVYGKPLFNLLESHLEVILVNPEHIKKVPGRKTDVPDGEWIVPLLQHGLKASFVPDRPIRNLRDLTRQRAQRVGEKAGATNRSPKGLEDATIKWGRVATDILGASGRDMLRAPIAGVASADALANLARGLLRQKLPQVRKARTGQVTDHHRFLRRLHLDHGTYLEGLIGPLDGRIHAERENDPPPPPSGGGEPPPGDPTAAATAPPPGPAPTTPGAAPVLRLWSARGLLTTIPGSQRRAAEVVLAASGTDLGRLPTSQHRASWAGLCPGNHESAGKRRRGRTTPGNHWLRVALVPAAWAATRAKNTDLAAQDRRLVRRCGKKKALIGVAHRLLGRCYQVLKNGAPYRERGADYLDRLAPERRTQQWVRQLESLGHKVILEPKAVA